MKRMTAHFLALVIKETKVYATKEKYSENHYIPINITERRLEWNLERDKYQHNVADFHHTIK